MVKWVKLIIISFIIFGLLVIGGCASKPSEEELRQLENLKAEVASLEKQIQTKQSEKASLEKKVAEQNGKLKQCQDDQDAVRKALGK